jgi:hypothetical protein
MTEDIAKQRRNERLYEVFTGDGKLSNRWSASGVRTRYDSEKKDIVFELPEGWTDTMTETLRDERRDAWENVGDPTYKMEYGMDLRRSDDDADSHTKLVVAENDDGTIEFRTNVDFVGLKDVPLGSRLFVEVHALAKIKKGDPVRFVIFKGEAIVPEKVGWLSENTPGFFFVLREGFVVFFHTLAETNDKNIRITHVSFSGRQKYMEKW